MSESETKTTVWDFLKAILANQGVGMLLILFGIICMWVGVAEEMSWGEAKAHFPSTSPWKDLVVIVGIVLIASGLGLAIFIAILKETDPLPSKVKPLALRIDWPRQGEEMHREFRLKGKLEKLPKDHDLGILETDNHLRYWWKGTVNHHQEEKSWETDPIPLKNVENRTFVIVLMDQRGKAIYDYLRDITDEIEIGNEKLTGMRTPLHPELHIPGLRILPPGMVECGSRTVKEVRQGRSRQA